jgi:hypothetical protein
MVTIFKGNTKARNMKAGEVRDSNECNKEKEERSLGQSVGELFSA